MFYQLNEQQPVVQGRYFVAPGARLIGDVVLGDQVSVWFNAVLRADNARIEIGAGSNVQDGSVLHVDEDMPIRVGQGVTIGHKVMLHGCNIGDGSLVGMNAVVLNGAVIGRQCLIGANALVTEGMQIPDRSLVLGSPAKVVRTLDADALARMDAGAKHYRDKIDFYNNGMSECAAP